MVAVWPLRPVIISSVAIHVPAVAEDGCADPSTEALEVLAEGDWDAPRHPVITGSTVATMTAATSRGARIMSISG
jgi:hypothetical protein